MAAKAGVIRVCLNCGEEFGFKNDPTDVPRDCPYCKEPYSLIKLNDFPKEPIVWLIHGQFVAGRIQNYPKGRWRDE